MFYQKGFQPIMQEDPTLYVIIWDPMEELNNL
jgi:hypothetical protein